MNAMHLGNSRHASGRSCSLVCTSCQHENSASGRFCTLCGRGLWETCPECDGEIAAQERFCGHCGTDVRGRLEEQSRQIQERLDSVAPLVAQHHYDAALAALRGVAALTDPKLERWTARALAELDVVLQRQKEALDQAQQAKQHAHKLVQEKSFEWAAAVLEKIPPPLRDAEATELLAKAQFAGKELTDLVAEIREAAKDGRTWKLFPKINRALALKPDQQAIHNLADQLRQKFIANARRRLAGRRYADAAQLLSQIPLALRTDEVCELLEIAGELGALLSDLNESPYATPAALALAQKLARHVPDHEEVAKLVKQLGERCASPPAHPRQARPYWTKPRDRSPIGPPIDWLGHFVRTQAATPQVRQALQNHPGEYFVAFGLALQGLGEAEFDVSLMPRERGNVLGKLATLPLLGKRVSSAWGIDLGSFALKAVKLVKSADAIQIQDAHYILLSKPLAHPEAEGKRPAILAEALSELVRRVDFKGCHVAAGLAGHQVLGRFFDLPPLPTKKVASAVEYETRHQFPIDLAELCWDWTEMGEADHKMSETVPQPIMVVAARLSHVQNRIDLFASAGIRLDSLQSNCLAIHNALRFELAQQPATAGAAAVLDVGADESNFVVSSPRSVWFRTFGLAGHGFTMALVQELKLAYEVAEEVKRHPAKARRYYLYRDALAPLLAQFGGELDRSLASYCRHLPAAQVKRLFVLGGGANLHGLLRHCISGAT